MDGQYTIVGAGRWTPTSYTSSTTPITSLHGPGGPTPRTRLPSAAAGPPHNSRARFTETSATGLWPLMSVQVKSRPASNRVPAAPKKPGETNLYVRIGGVSTRSYDLSSAKIGSRLLRPS